MFKKNGIIEDLKRFFSLKNDRIEAIEKIEPKELPKSYGVNDLAASLHPGYIKATISNIERIASNTSVVTLNALKFPYFKAGQFVTITHKYNDSIITRPYSIFSSPNEALKGILKIAVQNAGIFSNLLSNLNIGDRLLVGEPSGDFYYDNIRDKKNIVAIAGGTGITPFVSMAKAINENSDDFILTIIYGVKSLNDIIYDFKDITSNKVKVIPVLSEENNPNYLHGFITKDILKEYINNDVSVFMCGPNAMYDFVTKELSLLGYDDHRIRQEHNSIRNLDINIPNKYTLTVHMRDNIYKIDAIENETLLVAMEREGLLAPSRCRSGICGFCHSRLINGDIYTPKEHDHRRMADVKFGYIHPCATYPKSDIEIDVPIEYELKNLD